ncbi:MAG: alpha/beta hydrolase [Pseudomonadota bacterium]
MIPGFSQRFVETNGLRLSVHEAGTGDPLVLLHGYPQNHACWGRVAPELAKHFRVIVPDLRGYGKSDAPEDDAAHSVYAKRTMAQDIIGLLDQLGIARAHILGHDRGGRVTYRLALDHPDRVARLGIIEIVPTGPFWANWTAELAMKAYHWTFLAQPAPLPERMIGADPEAYMDWTLQTWTLAKSLDVFAPDALEGYRAQARDPARVHAMCADYRAGATYDRALDDADAAAGRKISAPLMFLWAEGGFPAQTGDPAGHWRNWTEDLRDASCISGHFAMEEVPEAVLKTFLPFFSEA